MIFMLFLDLIRLAAKLIRPNGMSRVVAEHLILRQQLISLQRKRKRAPRLFTFDRIVIAVSSLFIRTGRLPALSIVFAHSTVLDLHRALVKRKYSRLYSNKRVKKPGPKGPSPELIKLVVEIKTKNPKYGCPRIALLVSKLLDKEISQQTIRRIVRKYFSANPGSGPSWLNAIGTAKDVLWSMDLFCFAVVQGSPSGVGVCGMFVKILSETIRRPRHLSTDHDPLFRCYQWQANLRIMDIHEIKSVRETPWSHPFIERAMGTVRREYLDETLFWNERDLKEKLKQFQTYYNEARVHSAIGGTPLESSAGSAIGKISHQKYAWKSFCNGRWLSIITRGMDDFARIELQHLIFSERNRPCPIGTLSPEYLG